MDLLARAASESWERPSAVSQLTRLDVLITFKVILLSGYFLELFFLIADALKVLNNHWDEVSDLNLTSPQEPLDKM